MATPSSEHDSSASAQAVDSKPGTEAPTGAIADDVYQALSADVLGEHSDLYRLLVQRVQEYAIFALDPDGHILTWNDGAERIKGYKPSEIIGRHFSVFYPPADVARGKTRSMLEIARRDGYVADEGWRVRKDGSRFWASVVITALRDASGRLLGFAKVTRDQSDRHANDEALRQSEERFRLVVQSVKDYAIFMLNPDGRIATWNAGAEHIKGYAADEIIGKHFSVFYPDEDNAWGKPAWELDLATRDGRFEDEGWRVRKDGTRFWANVIITALRDQGGRLVGFAKVTRDLTERRAAEERAVADARRLAASEAANRTRSEFLAKFSHELRTPLNAIGGYAELIEMGVAGPMSEQQRDYMGRIRMSQQHLLTIINDLLNYSRIEAGQVTYDVKQFSVHEAVARVIPMISPQAVARSMTLEHGPCLERVLAWADPQKVEQIVLNLLSNAVKFTPEGGHISVTCGIAGTRAVIRVADTGPGIPAEHVAAIFEPFVQLGRSLNNPQGGTGLGLAISRDLARAMGGDLFVESTPGQGATFTLALRSV